MDHATELEDTTGSWRCDREGVRVCSLNFGVAHALNVIQGVLSSDLDM